MTIRQYHRIFTSTTIFFVLVLALLLFLQISADKNLDTTKSIHIKALMLSNELNLNSDILTRMARDYVMTGNENSLANYYRILDLRKGKVPRIDGEKVSFIKMVDDLGLTVDEKDLVKLSYKRSNDLAKLEIQAFNLFDETKSTSNKAMAQELLFGYKYMSAVEQIKEPLESFNRLLNIRIDSELKVNEQSKQFYFYCFYLILFLFFMLIIAFVFIIRKLVITPLAKGLETAYEIKEGDFTMRWLQDSKDEIGELAHSFNGMLDTLVANKEQFSSMVANVPGIIFRCLLDDNLTMLFISEQVELISGYPAKSFMNKGGRSYADLIVPEDLAKVQNVVAENIKIKKQYAVEYRIIRADGEERWVRSQGQAVFDVNDNVKWLDGAIIDITESKANQLALAEQVKLQQSLMDSVPLPIFYKDSQARFLGFNKAYEEVFGVNSKDLIGLTVLDLTYLSEKDRIAYQTEDLGVIAQQKTIKREMKIPFADGKLHDTLYWVTGFKDSENKPGGLIGNFIDITNEKENARRLEIAVKSADEATQAKSDFLANMSHEIRTPMNAVIGFSHLIQNTKLNEKQAEYIQKIESSSKSLLGIINDILDFSKIEAGKLAIEKTDFDLENVFKDLANITTYKAHRKELEIIFGINSNVPTYLNGDPLRLGQILMNLLNNAIKFTTKGEIVIRVNLVSEEKNHVVLEFSVEDSGIGIEKDKVLDIFKSFTQADSSTSRKFGGTGLGLAISKNLVELMNGKIWAESKFGVGTKFNFTVELKKQKLTPTKRIPPNDLIGLKVLVVNDNESSQLILNDLLESFSFNVTCVDSGQKAINLLKSTTNSPYELVLMDCNMPVMDGLEASDLILNSKEIKHKPIIIMLTAYGNEDIFKKAKEVGVSSILSFPVRQSHLFDTIMNSFGKLSRNVSSKKSKLNDKSADLNKIKGAQVLLVEDNETNQQVATELLESKGFNITVANNGLKAIEQVYSDKSFDIVLMDLQMPEMNGYEATKHIRKNDKFNNLPIIAMTADAMQGVKEYCLELGMNDFVTKPIDPEHLFKTLIKWIKKDDIIFSTVKIKPNDDLEPLIISGVNTLEGLNRVAGNKKLYIKLIRDFSINKENLIQEIIANIENNNETNAKRMLHNLKGISGNLGMMILHQEVLSLENKMEEIGWSNFKLFSKNLNKELNTLISNIKMAKLNEEEKPYNPKVFDKEKIAVLIELLADDDPDAIDFFNAIGEIDHPLFKELKSKINGYEFEDALQIVIKL